MTCILKSAKHLFFYIQAPCHSCHAHCQIYFYFYRISTPAMNIFCSSASSSSNSPFASNILSNHNALFPNKQKNSQIVMLYFRLFVCYNEPNNASKHFLPSKIEQIVIWFFRVCVVCYFLSVICSPSQIFKDFQNFFFISIPYNQEKSK